ncbi:MAG: DegT/DnrJ/EryC1/StrS family aminotransferase [Pseudomonadota bacterium]
MSEFVPLNDVSRDLRSIESALQDLFSRFVAGRSLVMGEAVEAFESRFAKWNDSECCVGCANGTDALELAFRALKANDGAKIAMTANAGGYAAHAAAACGANPVYVDVDPDTMLMDPRDFERVAAETDVVCVTHLYGRLAAMDAIVSIARAHNVRVVEDCAQAHGAQRNGVKAGAFGDIGCFSFYPTKNLGALGDGGAIVTDDQDLANAVRRLRQYGWTDRFRAELPGGRNSRLDALQADVLSLRLTQLNDRNARRRAIGLRLAAACASVGRRLSPQRPGTGDQDHVYHLFVVQTDDREAAQAHMKERNIGVGVHYPHLDIAQPALSTFTEERPLPNSLAVSNRILTLPCFPELDETEIQRVEDSIGSFR